MPLKIDPSFEFRVAQESFHVLKTLAKGNPAAEAALKKLRMDRIRQRQRLDYAETALQAEREKNRQPRKHVRRNGYDWPELTDYARDLIWRKCPLRCADFVHTDHARESLNSNS